jgi:hypothetical protein
MIEMLPGKEIFQFKDKVYHYHYNINCLKYNNIHHHLNVQYLLFSALEMKMYNMLEAMEGVCFNGRGLSLSGSACVTLPSKLTLQNLKYPKQSLFNEVIYHHLCLTWSK